MKFLVFLWLMMVFTPALAAPAEDSCRGQTELELSYCKLVALGAVGLPPLYEFRKNLPPTQYLLLKRPAARLGVSLPAQVKAIKKPSPEMELKPGVELKPSQSATPIAVSHPTAKNRRIPQLIPHQDNSACQLNNETITCGAQRYVLQWNKPKNALAAGVLTQSNQLLFPAVPASAAAHDEYLLKCYTLYVQKMLLLGLGNTTLSFAKFDGIFTEAQTHRFDFAARFTQMYHFLKEERKTLQPPKGFGNVKPQQIEECTRISNDFWTCQTAQQHWVFAKI